jgi:hypothetical protein
VDIPAWIERLRSDLTDHPKLLNCKEAVVDLVMAELEDLENALLAAAIARYHALSTGPSNVKS